MNDREPAPVGAAWATDPAAVPALDADGEPASIYVAVEAITPGAPEDPR